MCQQINLDAHTSAKGKVVMTMLIIGEDIRRVLKPSILERRKRGVWNYASIGESGRNDRFLRSTDRGVS